MIMIFCMMWEGIVCLIQTLEFFIAGVQYFY
jgi:hypothetical protein